MCMSYSPVGSYTKQFIQVRGWHTIILSHSKGEFSVNAVSYILICKLLPYIDIFKPEESKEDRTWGRGVIGRDSTCQSVSLCPVTVYQSLMKRICLFLP